MKNTISKIIEHLMKVPHMTKQMVQNIVNPLQSEKQLSMMLDYLEKNKNQSQLMRIDNLLKVRTQIIKEN